jgi:hypothetical protein
MILGFEIELLKYINIQKLTKISQTQLLTLDPKFTIYHYNNINI